MSLRDRKPIPMPPDVPRRYYVVGEGVHTLAAAFGVSAARARRWLRAAAVPIRRPGSPRRSISSLVARRYLAGESVTALAAEFAVTRPRVYQLLARERVTRTAQETCALRSPRPVHTRRLHSWELFSREEWEAMYWDPAELPSQYTLARRLGLRQQAVYEALLRLGIPIRSKVQQNQVEGFYGRAAERCARRAQRRRKGAAA